MGWFQPPTIAVFVLHDVLLLFNEQKQSTHTFVYRAKRRGGFKLICECAIFFFGKQMIYTHVYVYIRTYIHICRYTYIHISCRVKVTKLSWTHGTTCLHGDELHGCCMLRNLDKANSSVVTNPKPFQYTRWDPTIVISRVITPLIGVLIPATHL